MDAEKKAILEGRRELARDALDHAKACINANLPDSAVKAIEVAERQIEKWTIE